MAVAVEQVTLSVEAASVRLCFSVWVEVAAWNALIAALKAALPNANAASALLGVDVLTMPQLTVGGQSEPLTILPPQPHRDPMPPSPLNESTSHVDGGGGEYSSLALLLAGAGALLLATLLLVVTAVLFHRVKR